jgi:hypothetical protein
MNKKHKQKYHLGSRADVITYMLECAIRDRRTLIDAYTSSSGTLGKEGKQAIKGAKEDIEDFKRLTKTILRQNGTTTDV